MSEVAVIWKSFEGGWAADQKIGIKNSFAFSQSIDFRKSPSQLTILPGPRREDGVVNDLIQNEVMVSDGTIYAIGSNGGFYKRTTAGVWSSEAGINIGTYGMDYRKDTDDIYVPTRKSVSRFAGISGTPVMYMNYYGPSASLYNNQNVTFNVSASQSGGSQTYAPATTLVEGSTALRYFQSDIEPLTKISVFVVSAGTGDWTLTLHDGTNKVLGTATVTNANLKNGVFNDFVFTSATNGQVRIYVAPNARTYHIHVTSTVADGTLSCTGMSDMSTCDLQIWADRLVQPNNGMHPMSRFLQYECFGNGNYLSIWEPISDPPTNAEWQRHRLVFPMDYEVCGLAVQNEFIVIACERDTSNSASVPQDGYLFFWDGTSPTYNYFVHIPEGSPHGLHEHKNVLYYFSGVAWYAIAGPTTQPVKLRTMPGTNTEFSGASNPITIYPYASTVRRGTHLMAYPSKTTNTAIQFGVYSWGSVDKNFPDSFGYNYVISTGTQNYSASNNLQIGMTKAFGDVLHISWRDDLNGGYGVDVVDNTSNPTSTAIWKSIIFDNGLPTKLKRAKFIQVSYLPLPVGATIQPFYTINRGTQVNDSNGPYSSTVLYKGYNNYARTDISTPSDFFEIQIGLTLTATTATPTITGIALVFEDNKGEELF
jgi:hypothetical protein